MTDELIITKKNMPEKVKGYKRSTLKNGKEIEIPVYKTQDELYGPAYPSGNFVFTKELITKANRISSNCDTTTGKPKKRTEIIVNYLREEPVVVIDKNTGGKITRKVGLGCPTACIVGFKHNGEAYIGWSQSNRAGEPVSYSKKKARRCAILRGLVDTVTINGKTFAKTSDNRPIPSSVGKHLKPFVERTKRYFKTDFVNFIS